MLMEYNNNTTTVLYNSTQQSVSVIFLLFLLPVSNCFSFLFWGELTSSTDLLNLYRSLITSV